jgi:hypothetical protein
VNVRRDGGRSAATAALGLLSILSSACASNASSAEDSNHAVPHTGGTAAGESGGSTSQVGGAASGGVGGSLSGVGGNVGTSGATSGGSGVGAQGGTDSGPETPTCDSIDSTVAAPSATWTDARGDLAGGTFSCASNLAKIAAVPCSNQLIANVVHQGLFITDDDGASWQALGTAAGQVIQNYTEAIVFDPEDPGIFWEAGIHDGPGLFKTLDGGATFEEQGTISFAQLVSVDFGDPDRKTLLTGHHASPPIAA